MTQRKAEVLLAFVIMARATSLVFTKGCLQEMGTFNLLFMRFLTGFLLLAVLFWKRLRQVKWHTLWRGMVLGGMFFAIMTCEVTAAHTAKASTISALVNTAIILVPLINALLLRRRPRGREILCAAAAVAGVIFVNWTGQGLELHVGEWLSLLEAVLYACAIVVTDRFSHQEDDTLVMGVIQVGTLGVLALAASFLTETPHLPYAPGTWAMVAALAVVCTGFGFTLQPVAQRYTTAERSGLLCALNPVVATACGVLILHESLSAVQLLGILLILGSLLLPYIGKEKS